MPEEDYGWDPLSILANRVGEKIGKPLGEKFAGTQEDKAARTATLRKARDSLIVAVKPTVRFMYNSVPDPVKKEIVRDENLVGSAPSNVETEAYERFQAYEDQKQQDELRRHMQELALKHLVTSGN